MKREERGDIRKRGEFQTEERDRVKMEGRGWEVNMCVRASNGKLEKKEKKNGKYWQRYRRETWTTSKGGSYIILQWDAD